MGIVSVVLALIIGIFANIGYVVFKSIDYFDEVTSFKDEKCVKIGTTKGPEDLVVYGKYVLSGFDNRESLWGQEDGALHTSNGGISIIDIHTKSSETLPIKNFPDILFHPHGMQLINNSTLYVVNHAYNRGAERIDKLQLSELDGKVTLEYLSSVLLPDQHYGRINAAKFINENEFYATVWLPWSDTPTGRSTGVVESYCRLGTWLFRRSSPLYHCKVVEGSAVCTVQDYGYMMNGVEIYQDKVFASDAIDKKLYVYLRQSDNSLLRIRTLELPLHPDNIILSLYDSHLYIGCFSRVIDDMGHHEAMSRGIDVPIPGGVLKVNPIEFSVQTLLKTSKLSGISSAVSTEEYLVAGSWTDSGVLLCPN